DAAWQNVAGMPANVLLYSGPGMGKTTDAVKLFCRENVCTAFVIQCEPNGIKNPAALGLPVPEHTKTIIETWPQIVEVFSFLGQYRGRYNGVILDGFSALSTNLYKNAQEQLKSSRNKYDVPVAVRNQLLTLRAWLRDLGMHSVLTAHSIQPTVQEGVFYP